MRRALLLVAVLMAPIPHLYAAPPGAAAGGREGGMHVSSPAFRQGGEIPVKYTCRGQNVNPPLEVEGLPKEAKSLVLIVDDPDAPSRTWVHWVVFNIPPARRIDENSRPGIAGKNDSDPSGRYSGPCPPSGTHRYFFRLYALDAKLPLPEGSSREAVDRAMQPHVVGRAELMGVFRHR